MNTNKLMALLPDMAVFVMVVESGSFSAAAKQLSVTPSAVSRQISRLEEALAVRLLERTTRKQSPTAEGTEAYDKAKTLLECAREISQLASGGQQAKGRICISAPKAYAHRVLQPLVLEFLNHYPDIDIHFRVSDTLFNPLRDDVDIAFRLSDQLIDGLVNIPLHPIQSLLCASPSYLQEHASLESPNDLLAHSCLVLGEYQGDALWRFSQHGKTVEVQVQGRYATNHSDMRLAAVKQGLGIGIFPDFVVRSALAAGEVVQVLPAWQLTSKYQGGVSMQFVQNKFMPRRLRLLIDYFQQRLPEVHHAQ